MKNSVLSMALECLGSQQLPLYATCGEEQLDAKVKGVTPNGKIIVVDTGYGESGLLVPDVLAMLRALPPDMQISVLRAGWDDEEEELTIDETSELYDISSVVLSKADAVLRCRRHYDGG